MCSNTSLLLRIIPIDEAKTETILGCTALSLRNKEHVTEKATDPILSY